MPRGEDLPDEPGSFWSEYFASHTPNPKAVRARVRSLNEDGRHEHVVALIEAALIAGQSQPWMYEILALSMKAAGRPDADVQRVVLSLSDFGSASYDSLAQSARYLLSFDQDVAALRLLKQAAAMQPDRSEAYLMAVPAVERSGDVTAAAWVLPGVLDTSWGDETSRTRAKAKSLARAAIRKLRRDGRSDAADAFAAAVEDASHGDVEVTLQWDGNADLDLHVTDPTGETANFKTPLTPGDGRLLSDGFGPDDTTETYVCPKGLSGVYTIRVTAADGEATGGRATLTIGMRTPQGFEETERTIRLSGEPFEMTVELSEGRRAVPRVVPVETADRGRVRMPRVRQADAVARGGAFAAPVIQVVSEGTSSTAAATVSPDRRYVRLGLSPWFSSLTGVETFSFIGGNEGQ